MQNNHSMHSHVIHLLKTALPAYCHYHNHEHTLYVLHKVVEIGQHENCTPEEIELLKVAALWHDTGFVNTYEHHEKEGCRLATAYLTANHFSAEYIQAVCGMIMATHLPQMPKTKLEKIIADADVEYLGTPHVSLISESLFKEWQQINPAITREQWTDIQIGFLQKHRYFTNYCRKINEPFKEAYLQSLLQAL